MWEKIKEWFKSAWAWLKALPGKAWNALVGWLNSIRRDRLYHFICGLIIAAFFAITLKMAVCIVPVIFVAFIKEFIDQWRGGQWDWIDFAATCIGGLVPQIFAIPMFIC